MKGKSPIMSDIVSIGQETTCKEYETVYYDLFPLRNLKCVNFLGKIIPSDISESMLKYYYDYSYDLFLKKLNLITLRDLMIGGKNNDVLP